MRAGAAKNPGLLLALIHERRGRGVLRTSLVRNPPKFAFVAYLAAAALVLLDHHLALHALLFVAVHRAVHLVGAGLLEAHREHTALPRV
jgi:hypothetical protein